MLQTYVRILLLGFAYQGRRLSALKDLTDEFSLTPSELVALVLLWHAPRSVSEIASGTAMNPNGASVLVKRLSARGLIRKSRGRGDRRITQLTLTVAGKAVVESLLPELNQAMRSLLSPISESEVQQFETLQERLALRAIPADLPQASQANEKREELREALGQARAALEDAAPFLPANSRANLARASALSRIYGLGITRAER
jgi:DNA-binding MarR family transcriptional regulator